MERGLVCNYHERFVVAQGGQHGTTRCLDGGFSVVCGALHELRRQFDADGCGLRSRRVGRFDV